MKAVLTIPVFDDLGTSLNTREAATDFLKVVEDNPCERIELDFTNVEFMSRSFADQFHKEKMKLSEKYNILFEVSNANEEILNILRVVASTQNKTDREYNEMPVYKYSDISLLSDYLLSV